MATNYQDIDGSISVIDFSITLGLISLSSDKQKVVVNYTGYAYPERTDVAITAYEYSLDNGVTWATMTPSESTIVTDLTFSEAGTAQTFEWQAKADEGVDFYNVPLRIRLQGTSGEDLTSYAYGSYLLERAIQNLSTILENSPFPSNYSGISGSDLKQFAPKLI